MFRAGRRWVAVVIAASMVGVALGQAAKKQAVAFRELFLELDANQDRAIERDEVPESARAAFDRLLRRGDENHNGKLEADEYRSVLQDIQKVAAQAKKQAVAKFQAMDKDGDGKLSREEFTGPAARFDALDRDKDGSLTQNELTEAVRAKAAGKATAKKKGKAAAKAEAAPKSDDEPKPEPKPDTVKTPE